MQMRPPSGPESNGCREVAHCQCSWGCAILTLAFPDPLLSLFQRILHLLTPCVAQAQSAGAAGAHRAAGAGPQAPSAAFRRPAATCRACPSPGFQPALAAAGRALRRARPHGKQPSCFSACNLMRMPGCKIAKMSSSFVNTSQKRQVDYCDQHRYGRLDQPARGPELFLSSRWDAERVHWVWADPEVCAQGAQGHH